MLDWVLLLAVAMRVGVVRGSGCRRYVGLLPDVKYTGVRLGNGAGHHVGELDERDGGDIGLGLSESGFGGLGDFRD